MCERESWLQYEMLMTWSVAHTSPIHLCITLTMYLDRFLEQIKLFILQKCGRCHGVLFTGLGAEGIVLGEQKECVVMKPGAELIRDGHISSKPNQNARYKCCRELERGGCGQGERGKVGVVKERGKVGVVKEKGMVGVANETEKVDMVKERRKVGVVKERGKWA